MNDALVIVPTYNERENLAAVVGHLTAVGGVDVLVVDDNSPDGTGLLADDLAGRHPSMHVLHRREKAGLGQAYCAGFAWALERGYEFILEMDADLSHDPADVPRLIAAARNADLACGSRYLGGIRVIDWPLRRLLLSTAAALYVRVITGMPFTDPTGGFKCFRRDALGKIALGEVRSNGYSFQIEITHKLWRDGARIVELPIVFTERRKGRSKMSARIVREAVVVVWRLWFQNRMRRRPVRLQAADSAAPGIKEVPRNPA
jgi:dolichol-phosphate mannosyltransferase